VDWREIKLAEGDKDARTGRRDSEQYSVMTCLGKLLPEKKEHSREEKDWAIDLIERRFNQRFIKPLNSLMKPRDSPASDEFVAIGFTIMAVASLMIETLACFRSGQWTTYGKDDDPRFEGKRKSTGWLTGKESFGKFLGDSGNSFNSGKIRFSEQQGKDFYSDIRCGILHQGETKGGWRIWRVGEAIDRTRPSINALKFLKLLEDEGDRYRRELGDVANLQSERLWKACRYKILGICVNAGWKKDWPVGSGQLVKWEDYSP
jgi:hypothetical protein